jgi:multicomponent K+:H+ antiporter subunit A
MVTALGGLSLLGGVILLGFIAGTFEWTEILAQKEMILNNPLWPAVLLLILLGCFTKSAQFPFHFWLPDAMQAPTPVSAYLHSATMVKAGIFLLARFFPLFAGTALWFYSVSFVGITTMIIGSYIAFRQNDLKALLAYSTISHLGMIVTLLGFGTEEGAEAALFHVYNHAAFKASLFLGVGIVDHETGTRDLNKLGGIWKCLPQTAFLITVAAMAMAGIPFFNGFLSKELFLEATLSTRFSGTMGFLFPSLAVFASIFTMAYSVRLILKTFLGPSSKDLPKSPHEPFFLMRFPILFLGIVCMAIGIAPHIFIEPLLEPTVVPVIGHFKDLHLQIYHGINSALFMSMVAIAGGAYVYFLRERVFKIQALVSLGIAGNRIYQRVIHYLVLFAKLLTNALQSRSLRNYFAVCLIFSLFAIGMPFFKNFYKLKLLNFEMGPPVFPFYLALIIIAAFAVAVFEKRRLIAIICLGFVGTLVSLFFARMSAPDLALTQLSVEVCMTVAFLLVMYFLPKSGQKEREKEAPESKIRIFHDILLSTACAVGLALLLLITLGEPFDSISSWHLANSFEKAGGNNVVNVILVDFRGFDTMGEITVLGLAALGIMALVRARRQSP